MEGVEEDYKFERKRALKWNAIVLNRRNRSATFEDQTVIEAILVDINVHYSLHFSLPSLGYAVFLKSFELIVIDPKRKS